MDDDDYLHIITTDEQTGIDIYNVANAVIALNDKPNEMTSEY